MFKAILFAVFIVVITGCTNPHDLNRAKASYLCSKHGGIQRWRTFNEYPVACKDGTNLSVQQLNTVIIPVEDLDKYYK